MWRTNHLISIEEVNVLLQCRETKSNKPAWVEYNLIINFLLFRVITGNDLGAVVSTMNSSITLAIIQGPHRKRLEKWTAKIDYHFFGYFFYHYTIAT